MSKKYLDINSSTGLARLIKAQMHLYKVGEATAKEFKWNKVLDGFVKHHLDKKLKRFSDEEIEKIVLSNGRFGKEQHMTRGAVIDCIRYIRDKK